MNKTTKIKRKKYNTEVIKRVAKKLGVTTNFVAKSLRGDRKSDRAQLCVKQYKSITKSVNEFIDNQ
jgi:predicted transcriptional regulator